MKNKELAVKDFMEMTKKSWTYAKMNEDERKKLDDIVSIALENNHIVGNYNQRFSTLNIMYLAYCFGLKINTKENKK